MTYPCLPGDGIIGNNTKNHWDQYLSQKTPQICGKSGLIDFVKDIKLIYFAVWQIKDIGFVLKTKYISESDRFCVLLSATIIAIEKHIARSSQMCVMDVLLMKT